MDGEIYIYNMNVKNQIESIFFIEKFIFTPINDNISITLAADVDNGTDT
jgi:hypothetical protein